MKQFLLGPYNLFIHRDLRFVKLYTASEIAKKYIENTKIVTGRQPVK